MTLPILAVFALAGACSKSPAPSSASTSSPAATPAAAPAPPAAAPAPPAALPPAIPSHQRTQPDATTPGATAGAAGPGGASTATVTGKVIETMDAGGYTYVHLDTGTEKIWAATAPIKVNVGQVLTVPLEMPMENFHSAKLGRDFPLIYFASRVSRGSEPLPPRPAMPTAAERAAAMPPGHPAVGQSMPPGHPDVAQTMPPGHPPVGAASKSPITVTEVIPPPAGGLSVGDLWAKRTSLAGKTVVVRGKVVKFLGGIMNRNWVHLQDGTGHAQDGTNDITITTDGDTKPGDILTATGTLAIDKDFGAGYRYGAIIEGATLSKAGGS
jgi:hypothetical protein